jgi:hypothetical protein
MGLDMKRLWQFGFCVVLSVCPSAHTTAEAMEQVNLLPNGGFEIDADGDGIPDGWTMQTFNVLTDESKELMAPIARQPPRPKGLDLGRMTCIISSLEPQRQIVSAPVSVKPNTGYRLSGWYWTSGSFALVLPQVLDATKADANSPLWDDHMLNCISSGWARMPHWRRFDLPFRTPGHCDRIILRLWFYHQKSPEDDRRLLYDDFKLVEDDSVVLGEVTTATRVQPQWNVEEVQRGYAVFGRPAFPMTDRHWLPSARQRQQPLRFSLAAGETGSGAVSVRSLDKDLSLRVIPPGTLKSDNGHTISNAYGARAISLRAVENEQVALNSKQYLLRPGYLLYRCESPVKGGEPVQFWLTIEVPAGTLTCPLKSSPRFVRECTGHGRLQERAWTWPGRSIERKRSFRSCVRWRFTSPRA